MIIGIDARMYGPKQGGIGRYIEQLIKNLEKIKSDDEFVIFLRQENWDDYTPKNIKFKKILADIPWYGWREQILFPSVIKKARVDLMHFPHWNVPFFYKKPFVVTIHDLLLLHFPTREASSLGPISYFFKNIAFKIILRHASRRAKEIITVSEFSKKDINKTLGIPLEKIFTTHIAPFLAPPIPPAQNDGITLQKYGIKKPYILYVGNAYPHKNLNRLLKSWKIFTGKYGDAHQLVLAGREDFFYKRLHNLSTDSIIFTGFVSDLELPAIYKNSSLYIFPSLYEGFGIPPLEAMLFGIPVISSDRASLPEILEGAALYFNPEDSHETSEAIIKGLTDQNLREKLVKNAQNLLKKYSWDKTAEETLKIYRKCG